VQQKYQVLGALPKQIPQSLQEMALLLQVIRRGKVHTCFKDYVKWSNKEVCKKYKYICQPDDIAFEDELSSVSFSLARTDRYLFVSSVQ
jgi:hypothetical protein